MLYSYFFIVLLFFISVKAQDKQYTLRLKDVTLNEAATNRYIKFSEDQINVLKDINYPVTISTNIASSDGTSVYSGEDVSICTNQLPEKDIAKVFDIYVCPIKEGKYNIPTGRYIKFSASDASVKQKIEESNEFNIIVKIEARDKRGTTQYTITAKKVNK